MASYLKRYTDIMSLTDMLVYKRITLLPTTAWKDENDRRAMAIFKERAKHPCVAALCLTSSIETFHHWQAFSGGAGGVCIWFKREPFLEVFSDENRFAARRVEYLTLAQLRQAAKETFVFMPFLKRKGYQAEREFRVVGFSDNADPTIRVGIDLSIIHSVVFSPFTDETLFQSAKAALERLPGCEKIRWRRSTLTKSDAWLDTLESFPDFNGLMESMEALSRLVNESFAKLGAIGDKPPRATR